MIKSIWIDNFKSLVDFRLDLAKFSCLVGLNGSGKSTVLQAMDFLSQQMSGDIDEWLQERQWDSSDINSKLTSKNNIDFEVEVENKRFGSIVWSGSVNRTSLNCTREKIEWGTSTYLRIDDGYCTLSKGAKEDGHSNTEKFPIVFEYQGSILSQLKGSQLSDIVQALKDSIEDIKSLDLLSPELLRSRTKESGKKLGLGGQRLSAFIHESGKSGQSSLKEKLAKAYPQLKSVETKSLRSGWKQLEIQEEYGKHTLRTAARHMNDGMLRLMAIISQLDIGGEFLLFDEIENGINPELIEYLIDSLVASDHQVVVTTHSPMIINFLEDHIAQEGVIYLYKTAEGYTKSVRLFDIPSMAKKLEFMGPGEAFIDTDLTQLYQEIANMPVSES